LIRAAQRFRCAAAAGFSEIPATGSRARRARPAGHLFQPRADAAFPSALSASRPRAPYVAALSRIGRITETPAPAISGSSTAGRIHSRHNIAVTIHDQLEIPPRFLGTGEEPGQFAIFEKEKFVAEIL
jgi:hypothetical protein